jgi:hypothetical protein
MWEPRRFTTLCASTAFYRDSFTYIYIYNMRKFITCIQNFARIINSKRMRIMELFFYFAYGWGGGVQTGSIRHRGHLLSYCACPGWLWGWRIIRWNEDWKGKPKYSEKTCPSATLSTTNPTWPDPGSNPGRRGGKPATNRLSYGAAPYNGALRTPGNTLCTYKSSIRNHENKLSFERHRPGFEDNIKMKVKN